MTKTGFVGRQTMLEFSLDNGVTTFALAELSSFDWKVNDITKKRKPLGHTDSSLDVLNDGGTLTFECDKTDSAFVNLFVKLNKHYRALLHNGTRGRSPYFFVRQTTRGTDGSVETLLFKKVILHSPEGNASGADEYMQHKFQGEFDDYDTVPTDFGDAGYLNKTSGTLINTGLAYLMAVGEQTAISYVS